MIPIFLKPLENLVFHCSEDRVRVSIGLLDTLRERKRALTAEFADVHRAAKRVRKSEPPPSFHHHEGSHSQSRKDTGR